MTEEDGVRGNSTTAHEACAALIRAAQLSQILRATTAPHTFSRKKEREKGQSQSARSSRGGLRRRGSSLSGFWQ